MKHILSILIIFSFSLGLTSADVIENPTQPTPSDKTKKIGRTVKMTEVLRVSDIDGNFFLKKPEKIMVAPDGSFFVMDYTQLHLLKFNSEGKFMARMLNGGEGPGELKNLRSYWLDDREIIASGYMPVKVIRLDHQGKLLKEFQVNTDEYIFNFLGRFSGKYYFYIDPVHSGDGIKISKNRLIFTDEKGVITETGLTFPIKRVRYVYEFKKQGNQISFQTKSAHITSFNYAIAVDKYMYITTGERYLIQLYDFEKDKVVKKFRRQYNPVSYTPNPNIEFVNSPEFKELYKWDRYIDVCRLLTDGDRVWALTSTIDKVKGILVDVFSLNGKYIDRFYLQIPNLKFPDDKIVQHLHYYNGFLYTIGQNEGDNLYLVKYKLEE